MNLEEEIAELKVLLREHKITVPRHVPSEHPISVDDFMWDGTIPDEARQKIIDEAQEKMRKEGVIK